MMKKSDDHNAALAVGDDDTTAVQTPREVRKTFTGGMAAMLAIAASAPRPRERIELKLSPPMVDFGFADYASPRHGTPRHRRRNDARARMQKASRKRNRGTR